MDRVRIAQLLEPFLGSISRQQLMDSGMIPRISTYIDILQQWNARINLTSIRDEEEIVTRHFGESFFAARHLFPPASALPVLIDRPIKIADVGSGAGFPGIPIKLWAPDVNMTLIESNHKKSTFLREATRETALANVTVENVRAEALAAESFDIVTLRAVERFVDAVPVAVRLLPPSGTVALMIAESQVTDVCASAPNIDWTLNTRVPQSDSRLLLVGHKNPDSK